MYDRIVDGIGTVLLTLKKRPVIRYSQTCAPVGLLSRMLSPTGPWLTALRRSAGPKPRSASHKTCAASRMSRCDDNAPPHVPRNPNRPVLTAGRLAHTVQGIGAVRLSTRRWRAAAAHYRPIGRPGHAAAIAMDVSGAPARSMQGALDDISGSVAACATARRRWCMSF
jgi:hypothetical protein